MRKNKYLIVLLAFAFAVSGNTAAQQNDLGGAADGAELVQLSFPDNVELRVLIDYVSQRLGLNIIYDEQSASQHVTLRAPGRVPLNSLPELLDRVLRLNGLALIEDEQPGWLRVVKLDRLIDVSGMPEAPVGGGIDEVEGADGIVRGEEGGQEGGVVAVTRVFVLRNTRAAQVQQVLQPFLSQPGSSVLVLRDGRTMLVTDLASRMERIEAVVALADQPSPRIGVHFLPIRYADTQSLAEQVSKVVTSRREASGEDEEAAPIAVSHDARTRQLIVVALDEDLSEVRRVVETLDVPLGLETRTYRFDVISPDRIDRLMKQLIGASEGRDGADGGVIGGVSSDYRSAMDLESGTLVVTTTPQLHEQLVSIKADLDVPLEADQSPMRIYKLQNATALEVLAVVRELEASAMYGGPAIPGGTIQGGEMMYPLAQGASSQGLRSQSSGLIGPVGPTGSTYRPSEAVPPLHDATNPTRSGMSDPRAFGSAAYAQSSGDFGGFGGGDGGWGGVRSRRATITADPHTNSLIIIASPELHSMYSELIEKLDARRPQVLIEMTLVTLDTSDGFSLGVEIGASGSINATDLVTFSSFGLSMPDAATGSLSLLPGVGFNGAVVNSDIADVIIRALSTNARARVVSAPRVLVNDNATGTLDSVNEAPFTSVNASDTVATTSFGGFAEAGTSITVTPHISEGNHLQLEYGVTLSSFSGDAASVDGGLAPPPRQTNSVESVVTIPDGNTIIVGGLNRSDYSESIQAIPLLGQIPWLEYLFSSRTENRADTTLFVFIRPIILRDDEFDDLRTLSARDMRRAELPGDYPSSTPLLME